MKTSKDSTKNKDSNEIEALEAKVLVLTDKIVESKAAMAQTIATYIEEGEGDSDEYKALKADVELYEDVLSELKDRLKTARLADWQARIAKAEKAVGQAREDSLKARKEVTSVQLETSQFIRENARHAGPEIDKKRDSLNVLLSAAVATSTSMSKEYNKKRLVLDDLKIEFNTVAEELGAEQLEVLDYSSRLKCRA